MKYITVTTKEYQDAISKNLDVISSDKVSVELDFNKTIIKKTEKIVNQLKLENILNQLNLPLYLCSSLLFNIKFYINQKVFEDEIELRSGRKIYKKKENNFFKKKNLIISALKLLKNHIFYLVDIFTIIFFLILILIRSLKYKKIFLASFPGSGLGDFLINKKLYFNSLFLVSDVNKSLITNILEFIKGGQYLPFYPRKLHNKNYVSLNLIVELNDKKFDLNQLNSIINYWASQRKRDLLISKIIGKIIKPKIFISQQSLDQYAIFAYSFKLLNIPSLLISHGSHVVNIDLLAKKEWKNHSLTIFDGPFSFTAIQTPAAKYFHKTEKLISKPINTGPLILCKTNDSFKIPNRKELFGEFYQKKILLYASTPKMINNLRPLIYETEDEYINNLIIFINSIKNRDDIHLAIRHRDTESLDCTELSRILPKSNNYKIYTNGKFEDYLLMSDILISYSSTTIEQALFSNIKVLLWDSLGRYKHFDEFSIEEKVSRGIWFASNNNLSQILDEALQFNLSHHKNTFQTAYIDYLNETKNFNLSNLLKLDLN